MLILDLRHSAVDIPFVGSLSWSQTSRKNCITQFYCWGAEAGQGGQFPPPPPKKERNLSQWNGYACGPPPPILAITRHVNIFAPPPRSFAPVYCSTFCKEFPLQIYNSISELPKKLSVKFQTSLLSSLTGDVGT